MTLAKSNGVVSPSPEASSTGLDPIISAGSTISGSSQAEAERRLPAFRLSALLSVFTLAVLVPFLALAAYALETLVQDIRAAELQRVEDLAVDLAHVLDREIEGHLSTARVLTGARSLQRRNIAAFAAIAEDAARLAEGHFILTSASHRQLVNTRVPFGTPLPRTSDREIINEVIASGEVRIGSLEFGSVAQQLIFSVNLPVQVDGKVAYVLSFAPDRGVMQALVEESYRPEGWQASLVDANGLIVARSRLHDEFFGRPVSPEVWNAVGNVTGTFETVDLEGNAAITAYGSSRISGWKTFVWAPRSMLRQPAVAAQTFIALLLVLTLAASILAAIFSARLIRAPALRVVAAAEALAKGAPVRFKRSIMREANTVGDALTAASEAIRSREAALREAEARRRVVLQEMAHRAKNMLTVIQAIASQSGRTAKDYREFSECFRQRLAGLARSNDLLVHRGGVEVQLEELIHSHIAAFVEPDGDRVQLCGPERVVGREAVQHLGMAVHELCTNALKHGSLSVPRGRVRVEWKEGMNDAGRKLLCLRWLETGGPSPTAGTTPSFGSLVLEQIVPGNMNGTARLELRPEGLLWQIEIPMDQLT